MIQGFFKAELDLPHKAIPLAIHLKVEEALRASWDKLRKNPPAGFLVGTAPEDVVTHELLKILHGEVFDSGEVDGFTRDYFETPVREAKVENFDGTKRDLMPDLRIGLIGRPKARIPWQDYLFIECKPVDADHTVGAHYCDKGLIRFVRGDYAWAMRSAMMVGYARAGYTIIPKLSDALSRPDKIPTVDQARPCRRSKASSAGEVVHISKHGRTFKYLETKQPAAAITIRHLWLKRPD
jgi:hypothetical protein